MKLQMTNRWYRAKTGTTKLAAGLTSVALAAALSVSAIGCAQVSSASSSVEPSATQVSTSVASTESGATSSATAVQTTSIDESLYDLEYSNRDLDPSYDKAAATSITLSGATASVSGAGAEADGSTVRIEQEGVYVLSGTLDGQVVVEAPEDAKVQIVLDGATIQSQSGAAIYVKQADKCFITLADGSSNSVSDDTTTADDKADAAIYAACDLTLQGSGSLKVTGSVNDGVKTKDDLTIAGGTYEVTAVGDGLVGKDSVKVSDGTISVTAGNDGVKSSKDDDASKGFVSIDGGTLNINAADKGVKAVTYLRVEEGATIVATAGDDALHCDGCLRVDGGDIKADAGDDGVHAEYALEVNGGTIDVAKCVEGLEGQTVTINDGVVDIVSSDDGINASTPDALKAATQSSAEQAVGNELSGNSAFSQGDDRFGKSGRSGMGDMGRMGGDMGSMASDMGSMAGDMGRMGGDMMDADERCVITINGGTVTVVAEGDGIDSNGSIYVNGGTTYVWGPTDSGNGSLDYNMNAEVTGGTLVTAGASGMVQSFTGGTQAFALVPVSGAAGDEVKVLDMSGAEVLTFTPTKQYQCVFVTAPGLAEGATYTLSAGATQVPFEASTTGGNMGMGSMGAPGVGQMGGQGGSMRR